MKSFVTPLGCTVTVLDSPDHLGEGVILNLHMKSPLDGRMAEVFLDKDSMEKLKGLL